MSRPLRLYIHIPFCIRKCHYCDFLSFPRNQAGCGDESTKAAYLEALLAAIRKVKLSYDYELTSIFIGGGTPSSVPEEHIGKIMEAVKKRFRIGKDAEITMEVNPGTLDTEKLYAYRSFGINRISMGVQSLNDSELWNLGRIHDRNDVFRNVKEIRQCGFCNLNLDLMSGIPGQTKESWKKTLEDAVALAPEHISAYSLILEEGTPYGDYYLEGKPVRIEEPSFGKGWPALPEEDLEREMYEMTCSILEENGYHQYEISNYALCGRESRHNMGYWTGDEYLGLGLGAASYLKAPENPEAGWDGPYVRYACTGDMQEFLRDSDSFTETEFVGLKEAMEEFMFLGLRMNRGVSVGEFYRRFGKTMNEVYGNVIEKYVGFGLLERSEDRIRLTGAGVPVCNQVMADFL